VLARGWLRAASAQGNQRWLLALSAVAPIRELAIISALVRRPWPAELTWVMLTRVTAELHRAAQTTDPHRNLVAVPLRGLIESLASCPSATPGPETSRLAEALLGLANTAAVPGNPLTPDLERALRSAHDHLTLRVRLNREIS